jgi:DNA-binding GntR family transcriptional regulator
MSVVSYLGNQSATDPVPSDHGDVESPSLGERAYRELEELIITGQLAPGSVLTESALTARVQIGRTPIREALQRLKVDGLVSVLPRRGILISDVNVQTQLKMLEVRRQLEGLLVRLAVARIKDGERRHFRDVAERIEKAAREEDGIEFMRVDREFNSLLTTAAQNDILHKAMGLMHGLSRRFWYFYYEEVADLPLCAQRHAEVARAIADGNEEAAAAASDRLSDFIEKFTRAALDATMRRPTWRPGIKHY